MSWDPFPPSTSSWSLVFEVPDPGAGDVDNLRAIAASRTALVKSIDTAIASVRSISSDLSAHWTGLAADTNLNATLALVPDLTTLRASYEAHASALTTYAAEVDRIKIEAEAQAAVYNQATSDVADSRAQRAAIDGIGQYTPREYEAPVGAPAGTYDEDDWRRAVLLDGYVEEGRETIAAARAALEALVADRAAADQACADALLGGSATGPFGAITMDSSITQEELFALLATMSPTEAALFLNSHSSAVNLLEDGNPDNAAEVAALWLALGAGGTEVARENPRVVGNLEGASSWDRGIANQLVLTAEIEEAERLFANGGNRDSDYYESRLVTLRGIQTAVGDGLGAKPPRTIHSLDTSDKILGSIVLGDLDNAEYASYNVPGMDTTADNMSGWTDDSNTFYAKQVQLLIAGGMDKADAKKEVAVVAWIGYDTPNPLTVSSEIEAYNGAAKLDASIAGTQAQRDLHNPNGRLGVIAHSYGSTTAMLALSRDRGVDTLVTYGSAGEVIGSNPVLTDGWYQTQIWDDPWARVGQLLGGRPSPFLDPDSQPLDAEGGSWYNPRTKTREYVIDASGHSGYLVKDTASLHNMAAITIDRPDLVSVPEPPTPVRTPRPVPPN
ncbi:alpha/beta hydrolase family protein [Glaciihabitans tibetensis]|uniref:Alpha/beta hydrolase family protein n=1 Tax=Glaciihabitans tibetensis TaxID=1266600 RepID=A0A2T0VG53_9MICO|nr:alpha/beta hydrolase [Glaciihabitans tibetensis]PRY69189.1 alpha/beta hydrolase family protein [Glaciihabitans tibetensis]